MSRARDPSASITLGQMRSLGCRDLLAYCRSVDCNHSITMNADLSDDTPIRPLGDRMVCTKCGRAGARVQKREAQIEHIFSGLPSARLARRFSAAITSHRPNIL
jgi:hypothetical protein